jgi:inorganic pyrophosphatase
MTHLWHDLSPGAEQPRVVRAVIEIPGGSKNKYELDKESGLLKLDRVLFSAVHYPADYGFIPGTLGGDGDPLDILVLLTEPSFPGCLMEVRPLGLLGLRDAGERDEKILAVLLEDPLDEEYRKLSDVPNYLRKEIEQFFRTYKQLEEDKAPPKVRGWRPRPEAHRAIRKAIKRYDAAYRGG